MMPPSEMFTYNLIVIPVKIFKCSYVIILVEDYFICTLVRGFLTKNASHLVLELMRPACSGASDICDAVIGTACVALLMSQSCGLILIITVHIKLCMSLPAHPWLVVFRSVKEYSNNRSQEGHDALFSILPNDGRSSMFGYNTIC
jgi:hypothetical protein